ncbi:MAG: tetratricopeptide repeat protein [Phycisphaerales bacterium]
MKRNALAALVLLAGLAASGCQPGHGKYTSEALAKSQERVAGIKAANEFDQAQQAYHAGDLDKALKAVDRSLTINGSVCKSWVLRGRIMIERGDLEQAATSLQKAEAIDPTNIDAQYFLGFVHERFTQTDKALERYRKASDMDQTNPQYAIATAEMMIDKGDLDGAEQFLTSRGPTFEHNAGVRQTLGHIAMIRGDSERAVALFNEARLLAPDDAAVLENLVQAQLATGRFAAADGNLAKLQTLAGNTDRRDLKLLRARCLLKIDRPVEARAILVELTSGDIGQRDVDAWIELGNVCYVLRDTVRLRQAASRVVGLAPSRPEGYSLKALWQRKSGDLASALASADLAVQRRGKSVDPLLLRGLILSELGRTNEANACFAQANREGGTSPALANVPEQP